MDRLGRMDGDELTSTATARSHTVGPRHTATRRTSHRSPSGATIRLIRAADLRARRYFLRLPISFAIARKGRVTSVMTACAMARTTVAIAAATVRRTSAIRDIRDRYPAPGIPNVGASPTASRIPNAPPLVRTVSAHLPAARCAVRRGPRHGRAVGTRPGLHARQPGVGAALRIARTTSSVWLPANLMLGSRVARSGSGFGSDYRSAGPPAMSAVGAPAGDAIDRAENGPVAVR